MNKFKVLVLVFFVLSTLLLHSCSVNLTDRDFNEKRLLVRDRSLFLVVDTSQNRELKDALKFLFAYMPAGDISDYDGSIFEDAAKIAIKTRKESPWGKDVPNEIFRHFVLPLRVNNETLDSSRVVIFRELFPRVAGLTAKEAILEVNHWCHEYATYAPSDERTSSPLATMRNGEGRCGEESVLTVAALRAVGIPARLVYTPRWAHTDDNHAWVEAWADGEWYYIGACEPEPVLNRAWFTSSATRALLMHTRVFGKYTGTEEVIEQTDLFAEINVTENYAPVSTIKLVVKDPGGEIVEGAAVEFCIYNYSEFWPAIRRISDSKGFVNARMGLGDIVVRAHKGEKFGIAMISPREAEYCGEIIMDRVIGEEFIAEFSISPPDERSKTDNVTPEQIENNNRRLAREDSIRVLRVKELRGIINEVEKFRSEFDERSSVTGEAIITSLTAKDIKDVSSRVLNDHLANIKAGETDPYIVSPRVGREFLTSWRGFFKSLPGADTLHGDPLAVEKILSGIRVDNSLNPQFIPISPVGVWRMGLADEYSRDILFVALCRTFGIPSRLNPLNSQPEYKMDGLWRVANFNRNPTYDSVSESDPAYLSLNYSGGVVENPRFESHFSISQFDGKRFRLLSFRGREGFEGTNSYKSIFDEGRYVNLSPGYTLLTSGTRMADGKVLARAHFFNLTEGVKTNIQLVLREDTEELRVIGNMSVDASIIERSGRGYFIMVLLKHNHEPGVHMVNDIMKYKDEFEKWGRAIFFVYPDRHSLKLALEKFANEKLPDNFIFIEDESGNLSNSIYSGLEVKMPYPSPFVVVADTFGRIVYNIGGYSIGAGERLIKISKKL